MRLRAVRKASTVRESCGRPHQNVFRGNGAVCLELEQPEAALVLRAGQSVAGGIDPPIQ